MHNGEVRALSWGLFLGIVGFMAVLPAYAAGMVSIKPANPSDTTPVTVVISGQYGSSCPKVSYRHTIVGYLITIQGTVTDEPGTRCASVITPWSISVLLGVLPAGTYTLMVDIQGGIWSVQDTLTFTVFQTATVIPLSTWVRISPPTMFGAPSSQQAPQLFAFAGKLYAYNETGLYRLDAGTCYRWTEVYVPAALDGAVIVPLGNTLFFYRAGVLWRIQAGSRFDSRHWQRVTSIRQGKILPDSPIPRVIFRGQLYGVRELSTPDTFEIWRTPDLGKTTMVWEQVVKAGFGDPGNRDLDMLVVFNGKLVAATSTRNRMGSFGDPKTYGSGIEVWESPSGAPDSWVQVNRDGFGTETFIPSQGTNFRVNQEVGTYAIYKGALYIGTLSHFGAEVWRYTGGGSRGWTNVTPPWGGPNFITTDPRERMLRARAMAVFAGYLYLGEGYPSGNLSRYDGSSWIVVEAGPHPFDPQNGGINSLATVGGHLFATTLYDPGYSGTLKSDQVWADPSFAIPACPTKLPPREPELRFDPPKFNWVLPDHVIQVTGVVVNEGTPVQAPYNIAYLLDGELVWTEPGPLLGAGEEAEIQFSWEVTPGKHVITVVLDPENAVEELREDNNSVSHNFVVPGEGAETPTLSVEAEPVCGEEASHDLHIVWSAPPFERGELVLTFPNGEVETVEIQQAFGDEVVPVGYPAGGILNVTLKIYFPEGMQAVATAVELVPCR